ncbi:MAG: GIY-YIG nuclease family protein [Chloroflexi bacterium]|nr:GIY-YIG nuclease family protein [Chloroflexota bacterium]MCY3938338.1 GIY-YIG nuclease family protein [Chloroflexota bacterium]
MSRAEQGGTTPFGLKYRLEKEVHPFNRDQVAKLPKDRTGVYALWLPNEIEDAYDCLYVGISTTCIRRRLLQHITNETNPKLRRQLRMFRDIVRYSVAFTEGHQETLALETAVIRDWQPETNRAKLG